jgi:hypothetical protein
LGDRVSSLLQDADQLAQAEQVAATVAAHLDLDAYAALEPAVALLSSRLALQLRRLRFRCRHAEGNAAGQPPMRENAMAKPNSNSPAEASITKDDFERLANRAAAGSDEALVEFREVLRRNPAIYRLLGDLGEHSRHRLIDLIAGGSFIARETAEHKAQELREELLIGGDSPLERLAVDQVVTTWLDINLQQIGLSQQHAKETLRMRWEQRLDRAQRRHLAALATLAEVRAYLRGD